jgi:hypothetical protein
MNFLDIQNAVLSDRFDEIKRAEAKTWINYRYGRVWSQFNWDFKLQTTPLAVSINTQVVSRAGIGDILSIQDASTGQYYTDIGPVRPEDFYSYARNTGSGLPYAFTVIGSNIYFDRPMDTNRTLTVVSYAPFTPLVEDDDVPLIPEEFHYVLVDGAAATGLAKENDPSGDIFEQNYKDGLSDMAKEYLSTGNAADAYPSWP